MGEAGFHGEYGLRGCFGAETVCERCDVELCRLHESMKQFTMGAVRFSNQ